MQPTRKKASKYTGVFRAGNKWKAQLQHRNACIYLGIYDTEEKAAEVYNIEKAKVLAAEDAGTQPDIFYNNKKRGGGGASPRNSGGSRRSKGERVTRASSAPIFEADAIFSANSLHIMPWAAVTALFTELKSFLSVGAVVAIYGPFNYGGEYTSASNRQFDRWLCAQSPLSAIRDFEAVEQLAQAAGLELQEDNAMPANNRLLVWRKEA